MYCRSLALFLPHSECTVLGQLKLNFPAYDNVENARINLTMTFTEKGLKVSAVHLATGNKVSARIDDDTVKKTYIRSKHQGHTLGLFRSRPRITFGVKGDRRWDCSVLYNFRADCFFPVDLNDNFPLGTSSSR
jgi:hypothetical protein